MHSPPCWRIRSSFTTEPSAVCCKEDFRSHWPMNVRLAAKTARQRPPHLVWCKEHESHLLACEGLYASHTYWHVCESHVLACMRVQWSSEPSGSVVSVL